MTWQNLPCAPTLPALFAACPHGWAEIEFTYQRGNPTADPPEDADCSLEVRRLWGIENADEPALVDLLEDLGEPPLGIPHRDCILLARMEHHAGPCGICMREPDDEHRPSDPCPRGEFGGEFTTDPRLTACWGVDGKPVVFVGATPVYGLDARAAMFKRRCERYEAWFALPADQRHPAGPELAAGDMFTCTGA